MTLLGEPSSTMGSGASVLKPIRYRSRGTCHGMGWNLGGLSRRQPHLVTRGRKTLPEADISAVVILAMSRKALPVAVRRHPGASSKSGGRVIGDGPAGFKRDELLVGSVYPAVRHQGDDVRREAVLTAAEA